MGKRDESPMGIGVASVFTVLMVLALSVFAVLTLTSARADLALSRINADTVRAYYAADSAAAELYEKFAAGTEAELQAEVPMTANQVLRVHLAREGDAVRVLAWQVVTLEGETGEMDLPVWDGE